MIKILKKQRQSERLIYSIIEKNEADWQRYLLDRDAVKMKILSDRAVRNLERLKRIRQGQHPFKETKV